MQKQLYFGRQWDAPAWDDARRVPVPVGQLCTNCPETVDASDSGLLIWTIRQDSLGYEPVHIECWLRAIVGSRDHLKGQCSCTGSRQHADYDDEQSIRDDARATLAWLIQTGRGRFKPAPWWRRWMWWRSA